MEEFDVPKKWMTSRTARYGSNVAVTILLAFCILALVNFVSARHSGRVDTTTGGRFSLSEQTKKILGELDAEINITAFYTQNHYRREFSQDILNEYVRQSNKLHLNFIDPNYSPNVAIAHNIRPGQDGTVVFKSGDKREDALSYQNEEQDFTSAIKKLMATEQKKLYFLRGHAERDIDSIYGNLRQMIEADNYLVDKLVLSGRVPDDCDLLVIAGPQKPLLLYEEEAIVRYLDGGGKAIIMVDPSPAPSLAELLRRWGVTVHNDIILDPDHYANGILGFPASIRYDTEHAITIPLMKGEIRTFFPMARSLAPGKALREGVEVTELVKTSDDSWGESDTELLMSENRAEFHEGRDFKGPLCIAVAVIQKKQPAGEARARRLLVAVGDSNFLENEWLEAGNPDFFMNAVNWLTEEEELISIRPKAQEAATVRRDLSDRQMRFVMYSSVLAVPLVLLVIGGMVWWKRR